jgi:hypothetical protein
MLLSVQRQRKPVRISDEADSVTVDSHCTRPRRFERTSAPAPRYASLKAIKPSSTQLETTRRNSTKQPGAEPEGNQLRWLPHLIGLQTVRDAAERKVTRKPRSDEADGNAAALLVREYKGICSWLRTSAYQPLVRSTCTATVIDATGDHWHAHTNSRRH